MPAVQPNFLKPYIKDKVRHAFYDKACEMAAAMAVHTEGTFPEKLIGERRPAESDKIKDYRKTIYEPITMPIVEKVLSSLGKIHKSQDWQITYPQESPLPEGKTLMDYLEFNFPRNGSLTNWMFSVMLRQYLQDANACVVTLPLSFTVNEADYLQPYPVIFKSEQVYDYKEGQFFVLKDATTVRYEKNGVTYTDGEKFWVIQPDVIQSFEYKPKLDTNNNVAVTEVLNQVNPIGYIPVRWLNGIVVEWENDTQLFKSRYAAMLPKLNEAAREYSDLQAEIVQHIHSTMYSVQAQQCTKCRGFGECPNADETGFVQCSDCKGKGSLPLNPYEHVQFQSPKPGEPSLPANPIGYIQKSVEIAKLQNERVKEHLYDALASVNMEFLAQIPVDQSGVAKAWDRSESDNTVHATAEDVVRVGDGVAMDACNWRYHMIVVDTNKRNDMLPVIHVPEKYDMVSETYLIEALKGLNEAKADAAIINAAQEELAEKMFNTDPKKREFIRLKLLLDPFAGVAREDISLMQMLGVISEIDLLISANINKYVRLALQDDGFADLPLEEQQAKMVELATQDQGANNKLKVTTQEPNDPAAAA